MLAHADMEDTDGTARSAGAAPSGSASLTRDGQAGRRADPVRGRAGRRGRSRSQAPPSRPRRLGHGDARGGRSRRSSARSSRAASSARCARPPTSAREVERQLERAALDALGIVHKAGRVAIGFGRDRDRARRRIRWRRSCQASDGSADGARKIAAAAAQAPNGRKCGRNPDNCGVYVGAIGFGIGAVKCGTCCPACRPSEQRVPCALPEPRTLPDCRSGRTRHGIARG